MALADDVVALVRQTVAESIQQNTRWGKVTQVSPLLVQFSNDTTGTGKAMAHLSHYTPVLNDTVEIVKVGRSWVVQGAVA